jgi:hypothetical protein
LQHPQLRCTAQRQKSNLYQSVQYENHRRTHLYAGLFLAPWVAMYGFSGFIFNHGSWFAPGGGSKPIEWTVDVTALPQWPEPDALARKVVAALNAAEKDKAGGTEYRLSAEGRPKLQGGVSLEGQGRGGRFRLSLFSTGRSARARRFIRRPARRGAGQAGNKRRGASERNQRCHAGRRRQGRPEIIRD